MAFGITPTGFVIKRFEDIFAEIVASLKAATQWGPGVNVSSDSPLGELLGICAEREALVWEVAQAIYDSTYPDSATEASLDNVCTLIGVERLDATRSTVTETLAGVAGTVVGAGSLIATDPGGDQFETLVAAIIGAGGTVDVAMRAVEYGAIAAPAATLKTIITNVAGWDTASNVEDADHGREIETDAELRLRRFLSLQIGGRSTVGGLFANLLQRIDDVFAVAVVENDGDVVDAEGRPPHSVECIVKGGLEQEILDMIWDLKAAGIATCSTAIGANNISGDVTDSQGYVHTVNYSKPTSIDLWVHIEIEVDEGSFNVGSALKEKVTVTDNELASYEVTINKADPLDPPFIYTPPLPLGSKTKAEIATELINVINTTDGRWVPVMASEDAAGDDFFYLTSDYEGNDFSLTVGTGMTITTPPITPSSGDQKAVEDAVLAYAEANQGIGDDFIRSKYYTPVNAASDHILTINVRVSTTRWPNAGPLGGEANVAILMSQIGDLDTTRTTVEVI